MDERVDVLSLIAERKIQEAVREGRFDNLPGAGQPLPPDDLANLPDDLRLAWRILRGAGFKTEGPAEGGTPPASSLFSEAPEEGETVRKMTRLKLRLDPGRSNEIMDSPYLEKILRKTR
ncbi:MAG: DUF1992 domain-containing protein [Deltaproteobacteria bacterium]|jgi:hypothetical protein|nr:DUF1992 domain-containing protein [Deltaproteobacteria bacterium]